MTTLVQITAQYFENYNCFNVGATPNWKPKGGQVFNMYVDSDLFLYGKDICIEAIKVMLEEQCDRLNKFEYISHELIFAEPIVLNSDKFEGIFNMIACEKSKTA